MLLAARARPRVSAVPTGWVTSALENRHASFSTLRLESPQIPGINAYHGDVSVVCLIAGDFVAALEEERFRRIKRGAGVLTNAVRRCLGITRAKLLSPNNMEHHPAHLASALCVSAYDEAAVRTLTGGRKRVQSAT
jgi:predicted NodU family carbamoyl transferase